MFEATKTEQRTMTKVLMSSTMNIFGLEDLQLIRQAVYGEGVGDHDHTLLPSGCATCRSLSSWEKT